MYLVALVVGLNAKSGPRRLSVDSPNASFGSVYAARCCEKQQYIIATISFLFKRTIHRLTVFRLSTARVPCHRVISSSTHHQFSIVRAQHTLTSKMDDSMTSDDVFDYGNGSDFSPEAVTSAIDISCMYRVANPVPTEAQSKSS